MSLSVRIKKRLGLFDIDLDFETEDKSLGILGPSGCGKSMTLKCIAGIETPDEGRIVLNGRVLFDSEQRINLAPRLRRVGYLFQNYALFPNMTVAENIMLPVKHLAKKERLVANTIERFGLFELRQNYPARLSGGEKQRVALARMLVCEPEAVLFDEPLSALDTHLRDQVQLELCKMIESLGDVIVVTHNRDEAFRMCSRLLVMEGGRSLALSCREKLFYDPGSLRAAELTGCDNFSRASRIAKNSVHALDWGIILETDTEVEEDITHVGIRSHDLLAAGKDCKNSIKIRVLEKSETTFDWHIRFVTDDDLSIESKQPMTWIVSKLLECSSPDYLRMPTKSLLLLKDDKNFKEEIKCR